MEKRNLRSIREVIMVTVLEGDGTPENVYREVNYIYEGDVAIGIIDKWVNL